MNPKNVLIMKNYAVFLMFVFIITACESGDEKFDNASIEPNDKIQEANTIAFGHEFKMAIYPKGDVDWYKVFAPDQGYIEVIAKDVPSIDLTARFATYDEWEGGGADFFTGHLNMPAAAQIPEEGEYYIATYDRWGEKYSEDEFYLMINFIEEFDLHEPNNDPTTAPTIEFDKEYESAIFPIKDRDWFKFNVEEQGYIQIRAKNVPSNLDLSGYVATYDPYAANEIDRIKSITEVPFDVAITEPGEYYLVFVDRWGEKYSKELFSWFVSFVPEFDMFEPNNEFGKASEISGNDTLEIAIYPKGDRDFFKFIPEETGNLTVRARNYDGINLTVRLFELNEDNPNEISSLTSKQDLPFEFEIEETDKKYFLEFSDRWNENAKPELFEVVTIFE